MSFLKEREHLYERVNAGIDVHPAEDELIEFEKFARVISPNQDFSWRGCQECVNHMVKFVFDNQERLQHGDQEGE